MEVVNLTGIDTSALVSDVLFAVESGKVESFYYDDTDVLMDFISKHYEGNFLSLSRHGKFVEKYLSILINFRVELGQFKHNKQFYVLMKDFSYAATSGDIVPFGTSYFLHILHRDNLEYSKVKALKLAKDIALYLDTVQYHEMSGVDDSYMLDSENWEKAMKLQRYMERTKPKGSEETYDEIFERIKKHHLKPKKDIPYRFRRRRFYNIFSFLYCVHAANLIVEYGVGDGTWG